MLLARQLVAERPDHGGDHRKRDSKADIGVDDRPGLIGAILVERRARQLGSGNAGETAEDQRRADAREDRRSQAVERLREGQPAVHRFGRSEQADQWIGNHLDDDDPARQHEQREQEQAIGRSRRGRDEQQAADHHRQQARHRAAHVADLLDQLGAWDADHEIGREEAELDQHGLGVVEREQLFQLRNDDVVEAGDSAEDEKQRHHEIAQVGRVDSAIRQFQRRDVGLAFTHSSRHHHCANPPRQPRMAIGSRGRRHPLSCEGANECAACGGEALRENRRGSAAIRDKIAENAALAGDFAHRVDGADDLTAAQVRTGPLDDQRVVGAKAA